MIWKAKTKTGFWVHGFLIGYYSDPSKTEIEEFKIFEGIRDIPPVSIVKETVCEYVCKDRNGNDAFENDIIEFSEGDKKVKCILVKSDMGNNGYELIPNYQLNTLWRLKINKGVGNFKVICSKFDKLEMAKRLYGKEEKNISSPL